MTKIYNRGTLSQFQDALTAANAAEGIPPEGKVGMVNGVPAPDNQRTTAYTKEIKHPTNPDDYIWAFGDYPDSGLPQLDQSEAIAAGFISDEQS